MARGGRKRPRVVAGDGDGAGAAAAVIAHPSQPNEEHREYEVGSMFMVMAERQTQARGWRSHSLEPAESPATHHPPVGGSPLPTQHGSAASR